VSLEMAVVFDELALAISYLISSSLQHARTDQMQHCPRVACVPPPVALSSRSFLNWRGCLERS
jgi:hypothetical protein